MTKINSKISNDLAYKTQLTSALPTCPHCGVQWFELKKIDTYLEEGIPEYFQCNSCDKTFLLTKTVVYESMVHSKKDEEEFDKQYEKFKKIRKLSELWDKKEEN